MKSINSIFKYIMRFGALVYLTLSLVACDVDTPQSGMSDIVARVNGEPVTRVEFERMRANPALLGKQEAAHETTSQTLEELALSRLIESRLLLQEARSRGFTVAEKSVDDAVKSMRNKFADLKQFGAWIQAQGLTEPELFQSVRDDMLVKRVTAALAGSVEISVDQVRQFYEENRSLWREPGDMRLRVIAVNSRTAAESIVSELRAGADFISLARRFSMGARAAEGGDVGWVDSMYLPSPLREVVTSLKTGQAYGPLQRGEDYLVVRVDERRPIQIRSFAEVQPLVEMQFLQAKQRAAIEAWLVKQQAQAEIEIILHDSAVKRREG